VKGAAPPVDAWQPPTPAGILTAKRGGPAVAFSPDGRTLAAGNDAGKKGRLLLWEVASRRVRAELPPHRDGFVFSAAAFGPGGLLATASSNSRAVRVWDLARWRVVLECAGDGDTVSALALSADGRLVAVASARAVTVWDVPARKKVATLAGHAQAVPGVGVAFSPDGKTLATGGDEETVRLWEMPGGRLRAVLRGHKGYVGPIAFSPCGKVVASGGASPGDYTVRLWDAETGKPLAVWSGHSRYLKGLAFSPDGRLLAAGVDLTEGPGDIQPGEVRFYDVTARRERGSIRASEDGLSNLAFSPAGGLLAVNAKWPDTHLWRVPAYASPAVRTERGPLPRVPPPGKRPGPVAKEVESLWPDLAGADAKRAYRAIWALAGKPEQAVALLGRHLRPLAALDETRVARLIAALGGDSYVERTQAERDLERLGDLAAAALRRALGGRLAPEPRRRVERLLARLEPPIPPGERLRAVRAIEVLELIANDAARRLLSELATGAPGATLTEEARASVQRLDRRK
jgi:hypothetical protein